MQLGQHPPLHLTYCLNIHPGETLAEHRAAIREHAVAVKQRVSPAAPLGLGLRLGAAAAAELRAPAARQALRAELDALGLYAFTINGFPYGQFHGARVKENVYAPDWRTQARLEYTCLLADILAELLPAGVPGSISTLPGSFKPWIHSMAEVQALAQNLVAAARHLAALHRRTGREIHLGLEPEPFCFLETTEEVIRFFEGPLAAACADAAEHELVRRHLGVCLDTCHVALQFETPLAALRRYRAAGLRVSKIQLSAALETTAADAAALRPFDEPVYLHQTKARFKNGALLAWPDLPDALPAIAQNAALETVRVHFHVPLFWEGRAPLRSTAPDLNAAFFREAGAATEHLEVETYTFAVLPAALRAGGVVACVSRELEWVRRQL